MNVNGNPRVALEPKLLKTEGKTSILSLRVIEDRDVRVKGVWEKRAVRITVLTFGKFAESLATRVKKGDLLEVNGELSERVFTDKAGNTRSVHEVIANKVKILRHASVKP